MRILLGDRFFDGSGGGVAERTALVVDDEIILDVLPPEAALDRYPDVEMTHFPGCTVLPGLVNAHSHLVMPGDGSKIEDAMEAGDDELLVRAARNARLSLGAGVTTLTDLGGRNDVTFSLRKAIEAGEMPGPRLILAGRAVTSPRGHCWQFNAEVDNLDEMKREVESLFASGADLLKVMANGGGTQGTDPFTPQFSDEMLAFAANMAKEAGKPAFAHCSCTTVVRQAVEAGFDVIVHGNFNRDREELDFDEDLVRRALDRGIRWNPTLEITRCGVRGLEESGGDPESVAARWAAYGRRTEEIARLRDLGVVMIAGSDEGWGGNTFGNFAREVEALTGAGYSNGDALRSATSWAAESLGIDDTVGTLVPGRRADVLVVEGNPLEDIEDLARVRAVYLGGTRVELDRLG